ncbi:MAG: aminopeptidase [Candidatus Hodarchaeota archaeon]
MEKALLIDYEEIRKQGEKLEEQLLKGKTIRKVTDQGTDLIFQIDKEFIQLDDGIVSEKDVAKGHLSANLPAGILEAAPIEGSTERKVLVDSPQLRLGKIIEKTQLEFKTGQLIAISAEQSEETLKKTLNRICTEKPILSRMAIGLNPNMEPGFLFDEVCQGRVTLAVGGKQGGCLLSGVLQQPTIYIDDEKLTELD